MKVLKAIWRYVLNPFLVLPVRICLDVYCGRETPPNEWPFERDKWPHKRDDGKR